MQPGDKEESVLGFSSLHAPFIHTLDIFQPVSYHFYNLRGGF